MPHLDLVTTAEATELLEIDRSTLTRWVASGRLVPVKKLPGKTGAYLFDRAAVKALAELDAEDDGSAA